MANWTNTKHGNRCLENAGDDEPLFVIRAKDDIGPRIVEFWADELEANGGSEEKAREARDIAAQMQAYQERYGSKLPD